MLVAEATGLGFMVFLDLSPSHELICCKNKISTLRDDLEKYWPSLSCGSSSTCHGEKHGTCSFPVIRDEYNYFFTVLNLYFKYNVTEVLNEAGYVPCNSEKYPLGGIVFVTQIVFRATPLLVCSNGSVHELHLCFYKDFKPRDSVNGANIQGVVNSSKSSCPSYISLPAYVSFGLEEGGAAISWLRDNEAL